MSQAIIIEHPLVQNKLSIMRDKQINSGTFRMLANELSELLCYEATRNLNVAEKNITIVPILRAGIGMLEGALRLIPLAQVGHIGLYRDPNTVAVIEYYFKMPANMESKHVLIIDPMIATGNSAAAALSRLKESKPQSITFICIVASAPGVAYLQSEHPDINIYTAAIDEKLDSRNYIVPGLGDAGDRIFGTI